MLKKLKMKKGAIIISETRESLIEEKLGELLFELLWYYNRLRLEETLINYEYMTNPIIRRTSRINPLDMLLSNTEEPGLTKEDITSFNTNRTEDYSDFIDRFCEFFQIYGIDLINYDTGKTFIFVNDTERYLNLLIQLEKIGDKNSKYLVRAVDVGIIESKKFTYDMNNENGIEIINKREWVYFQNIPQIIDLHNKMDPDSPEDNKYLRKRIIKYFKALKDGCLADQIGLEKYLPAKEVGPHSKCDHLSEEIITSDYMPGWKIALTTIKVTIRLRGGTSKKIIEEVLTSLKASMAKQYQLEAAKKPDKKAALDHYSNKLREIEKMELVDPPKFDEEQEIAEKPYNEIIKMIGFIEESEYPKLKEFISKLEHKPPPF